MATDTYILTLDPNGGFIKYTVEVQDPRDPKTTKSVTKYTTEPITEPQTSGQRVQGLPESPRRPGYSFQGWYRTFPGTYAKNAEKQTRLTSSMNWTWNRDLTFTARWNPQNCTIRWNGNGGKWGSVLEKSTTTNCGHVLADITWFNNPPQREGYEFLGWFTAKEQGDKLTEYSQVDKSRTYFAHWKKLKEYLVTFDANGGEGGWSNWMYIGYPITAPEVTFDGYTFGGWLPNVDEVVPDHNVTYVAQWDSNVWQNAN